MSPISVRTRSSIFLSRRSALEASAAGVMTSQLLALPRAAKASELGTKANAKCFKRSTQSVSSSRLSSVLLLLLVFHVTFAQAYGSCCVGAADVCEATYDDNFFFTYHCVGANWIGPLQICEACRTYGQHLLCSFPCFRARLDKYWLRDRYWCPAIYSRSLRHWLRVRLLFQEGYVRSCVRCVQSWECSSFRNASPLPLQRQCEPWLRNSVNNSFGLFLHM